MVVYRVRNSCADIQNNGGYAMQIIYYYWDEKDRWHVERSPASYLLLLPGSCPSSLSLSLRLVINAPNLCVYAYIHIHRSSLS